MVAVTSVCMLAAALALAVPVSKMFVGYNPDLEQMTVRGFFIFSFGFLFAGASIFASSFFTALNNGLISAIISFMRTLVFQVAAVLLLPLIFERLGGNPLDGIWLSIVAAEVVAALVSLLCILFNRKQYGYMGGVKFRLRAQWQLYTNEKNSCTRSFLFLENQTLSSGVSIKLTRLEIIQ